MIALQGMEDLIKQAFLQVDVLGPHVQEGHYDLIGPDGEIILPSVWEKVVQPDWAITMTMWPMDKSPQIGPKHGIPGRHGHMPMAPPGRMPPGMAPPAGMMPPGRRPGGPPGGIPPVPGWHGGARPMPPNIINVNPPAKPNGKPSSKKKQDSSWIGFLAGKPPKKK